MPWTKEQRNRLIRCESCQLSVKRKSWRAHLQTHGEVRFPCEICNVYNGVSIRNLKYHQRAVHNIGPESINDCVLCKKKLNSPSQLELHVRSHTKERPYFCKLCSAELFSQNELRSHLRTHDPDRKPDFHCPVCSKGFSDRWDFKKHIARVHLKTSVEKPYKCKECAKCFLTRAELRSHLRSHTKEKPYVCNICGKSYSHRSGFVSHMLMHKGAKPFACKFCKKGFRTSSTMNSHIKRLHQRERLPFKCDTCDQRFLAKVELANHERTHTWERPLVCKVCKKTFSALGVLSMHVRIHTGDRRHECNVCKKRFMTSTQLKTHLKTHDKAKISCKICQRTLPSQGYLLRHFKRMHPNELG